MGKIHRILRSVLALSELALTRICLFVIETDRHRQGQTDRQTDLVDVLIVQDLTWLFPSFILKRYFLYSSTSSGICKNSTTLFVSLSLSLHTHARAHTYFLSSFSFSFPQMSRSTADRVGKQASHTWKNAERAWQSSWPKNAGVWSTYWHYWRIWGKFPVMGSLIRLIAFMECMDISCRYVCRSLTYTLPHAVGRWENEVDSKVSRATWAWIKPVQAGQAQVSGHEK